MMEKVAPPTRKTVREASVPPVKLKSFYETPLHGEAFSAVRDGFTGPCAVVFTSPRRVPLLRAVFPNFEEASRAARYAVEWFGGYDRAEITEAVDETPTHPTWDAWAFG